MKDTLPDRVRVGAFEVDLRAGELRNCAGSVYLQDQPLVVLRMLVGRAGEVVTREEIKEQLWPDDTVVDFDRGINTTVRRLRQTLGDTAEEPKYVATVARRGYRLLVPVERVGAGEGDAGPTPLRPSPSDGAQRGTHAEPVSLSHGSAGRTWLIVGGIVAVGIIVGAIFWRSQGVPKVTERATVVIADFKNDTGDPLFDVTLKQALSAELSQSPFINVLSVRKVRGALKEMNRSANARLSEDVAREVCRHVGSKAVLIGAIGPLEKGYLLKLEAADCNTGDVLAEAQERAPDKDGVLRALDEAAIAIRKQVGEPLGSVRRYAVPLAEATTPSLEAWKAYAMGHETEYREGATAALPFFKRAVELDPSFAMAYSGLSVLYANLNEVKRAQENASKAYSLRNKVSERERLVIEATYYDKVTGELENAAKVYELWRKTYPKDLAPYTNLCVIYGKLGQLDNMLQVSRDATRLEPNAAVVYVDLATAYGNLNRLTEAEEAVKQAGQHNLAQEYLLVDWYELAFLRSDSVLMEQTSAAAMGKLGTEDLLLAAQADTEGWYGRLKNARKLTISAMASAQRNDNKEVAASYQIAAALREVATGIQQQARADVLNALKLAPNRDTQSMGALVLALAGDSATAETAAVELDNAFHTDTLVQQYWLPTIRAAVDLQKGDPDRAIAGLQIAGPIELSNPTQVNIFLCPVYLRGEAYLMLHDGKAAAVEFQKFLDHYGLISNFPWGALARLGVARAYALEAQTDPAAREKARTAYQNFLTIWKDADPDIPVYKQAKAEYAKLQ